MIVMKVGGSLYDHPDLFAGLLMVTGYVYGTGRPHLLVPGGGPAADAVRQWQRVHRFGDTVAHWLAVRSLSLTAHFLASSLLAPVVAHPSEEPPRFIEGSTTPIRVLDPLEFCRRDDELPMSWDVTSDSIAARAAVVARAEKLVLLKSIDIPPGTPWEVAAANGWVDPHFPRLVAGSGIAVEAVDLRAFLASIPDDDPEGKEPLPPPAPGPYDDRPMGM